MKRFFALLLCAALLLSVTGCGNSEEAAPTEATIPVTIPATEPDPTAAPAEVPAEVPTPPVPMGETVLLDNESVTFTVVKAENNEHLGMQIYVNCLNKTTTPLLFSWDMVSVCGYMYDPFWAVEVAAGKSVNSVIELDTYALEKMGVFSVDEITFTLRVVDSENWMDAPIVQDMFSIYPTGLSAETLILPQRVPEAGHMMVVDNENLCFAIESTDGENNTRYTLSVYLQNKTDRNLIFSWDLVSVNGMMIDPFWATSVAAGKSACSEITFYRSDLESNGIADVSEIEFTLLVSDYDNWETGNLLEETHTYHTASVG